MAAIPEVQRNQPIPIPQPEAPALPASKAIFTQIKEKAIWAWDVSVQNLKTAAEATKRFLQRIIEAVRAFFAPKVESAKQILHNIADNLSLKLGARIYTPRIDSLKSRNTDLENRLNQTTQEKDRALQANQALTQELAQLRQPPQPQLPPPQPEQPVLQALPPPEPQLAAPVAQPEPAPVAQLQPQQVQPPAVQPPAQLAVVPAAVGAPAAGRAGLFNFLPAWAGGGVANPPQQ